MNLEERLNLIQLRLKNLKSRYIGQRDRIEQLQNENNQLKAEVEKLKNTNFELNKQIDIADIANQLGENQSRDDLKYTLDKYIREVDSIINELKK